MASVGPIDWLLRRDRMIVGGTLLAMTFLAWGYFLREAHAMTITGACCCAGLKMSGPDVRAWSSATLLPLFLMWTEMMVAMMLPSAAPMVLTFAAVNRKRSAVIAVTNTPDSSLAKHASAAVMTRAGGEFSVSCKTYVTALMALKWLGDVLCERDAKHTRSMADDRPAVPGTVGEVWEVALPDAMAARWETDGAFMGVRGKE